MFYIENISGRGNCRLFWRVDGDGYTCNFDEAWKVDALEADRICRSRPTEDFARPAEEMEAQAVRHVPR